MFQDEPGKICCVEHKSGFYWTAAQVLEDDLGPSDSEVNLYTFGTPGVGPFPGILICRGISSCFSPFYHFVCWMIGLWGGSNQSSTPNGRSPSWGWAVVALSMCTSPLWGCLMVYNEAVPKLLLVWTSTFPLTAATPIPAKNLAMFLHKQRKMVQMGTILYVWVTNQWAELNHKLTVSRSIGLISVATHPWEVAHPSQTGCSRQRRICLAAFLISFAQL